jgi:hypothetical protein
MLVDTNKMIVSEMAIGMISAVATSMTVAIEVNENVLLPRMVNKEKKL